MAEDAVAWARALTRTLDIPTLGAIGVRAEDLELVASQAARSSSMKGNPIVLTDAELRAILERAL
ncbi:MAG: iron-containing alcohol dehydrogenase [Sandaracinus sp.]